MTPNLTKPALCDYPHHVYPPPPTGDPPDFPSLLYDLYILQKNPPSTTAPSLTIYTYIHPHHLQTHQAPSTSAISLSV